MSTAVLIVPAITTEHAKQSAWLVPVTFPLLFGLAVLWIIHRLGKRFPGLSIVQYSEVILGKFAGKLLGISISLFWLLINILVVEEFTDFLSITMLPHTPTFVLTAMIVLLSFYGAWQGIEVITRSAQFVFPLLIIGFFLGLVLSFFKLEFGYLLPVFEDGIIPIIRGSIVPSSWFGEIAILLMLLPMVNKPAEAKNKGAVVLIALALYLLIDTAFTIGTFGPELTSRYMFPFWSMFRNAGYRDFIQRIEILGVIIWLGSVVIKSTTLDYLISVTVTQVFGFQNRRYVLYVLPFIQVPASMILFTNSISLKEFLGQYWPPIAFIFELVIPMSLLFIAVIRKKRLGALK